MRWRPDTSKPPRVKRACGCDRVQAPDGDADSQEETGDHSEHAWLCSICLEGIDLAELAVIRECQHTYCGASRPAPAADAPCPVAPAARPNRACSASSMVALDPSRTLRAAPCIVQWAAHVPGGGVTSCPTCKQPFTQLQVHRALDGALSDAPLVEPIALLRRAPWFLAWQAERSQVNELTRQTPFRSVAAAESERSPLALAQEEWAEEALYGYFEAEYDGDYEELEERLEQPRGRIAIGNRRCDACRRLG